MDLQVVLATNVMDDKVTYTIEVDLGSDPLVGELKNSWSELSVKKDKVLSLTMRCGSYVKSN